MRAASRARNSEAQRSSRRIRREPDGKGGQIPHLTWGGLSRESAEEVIRGRSSEEAAVTAVERRAEEPKNGAREGTGDRRKIRTRIPGATTAVANLEAPVGGDGAAVVSRGRRDQAGIRGPFDRKPCTRS
jgi:hypothetical protein